MEMLEEIETKVEENQIGFDFLDQLQPLEKTENFGWVAKETLVLLADGCGKLGSNFEICGKKLVEWVSLAVSGCDQKRIVLPNEEDILQVAKEALACAGGIEKYQFVVVLFCDTPLLKKSTFFEIMTHFSQRKMNVMRLSRGYVFRAEWLKNALIMLTSAATNFGEEDFVLVDSAQKANFAFKTLQQRILQYHKQNGVVLFGENTIFIDADVEIEPGVVIYPNNILKGRTYVGKNVILESGNYVLDSILCDEVFVQQSFLENCKVEKEKIVGPFSKLIGKQI